MNDDEQPSSESRSSNAPRRRWRPDRLKSDIRSDDTLVIKVEPALPGGPFGNEAKIETLISKERRKSKMTSTNYSHGRNCIHPKPKRTHTLTYAEERVI